jgi:hypothetical protein
VLPPCVAASPRHCAGDLARHHYHIHQNGVNECRFMQWGLIPRIGPQILGSATMINARAEIVKGSSLRQAEIFTDQVNFPSWNGRPVLRDRKNPYL